MPCQASIQIILKFYTSTGLPGHPPPSILSPGHHWDVRQCVCPLGWVELIDLVGGVWSMGSYEFPTPGGVSLSAYSAMVRTIFSIRSAHPCSGSPSSSKSVICLRIQS